MQAVEQNQLLHGLVYSVQAYALEQVNYLEVLRDGVGTLDRLVDLVEDGSCSFYRCVEPSRDQQQPYTFDIVALSNKLAALLEVAIVPLEDLSASSVPNHAALYDFYQSLILSVFAQ